MSYSPSSGFTLVLPLLVLVCPSLSTSHFTFGPDLSSLQPDISSDVTCLTVICEAQWVEEVVLTLTRRLTLTMVSSLGWSGSV